MIAQHRSDVVARAGGRGRVLGAVSIASVLALLLLLVSFGSELSDSAGLVKLRNAMLLQAQAVDADWTPDSLPDGFMVDAGEPIALYRDIVAQNGLVVPGDDWATSLAIGRHMLIDGKRAEGPIQGDLAETYRRIVERGEGYCGDFTDSFAGLAAVAGVFVRTWSFSFDGFGGHGHTFSEIWDRQKGRWTMIDVFNNFYPEDSAGNPLSATTFRQALLEGRKLRLVPVDESARPGFVHKEKAFAYYRRGLPQWYMWWGNNVFEYDQSGAVRLLGEGHRALEQFGAILSGVHPGMRILYEAENREAREALYWMKWKLLAVPALALLALIAWIGRSRAARGV